MNDLNKEWKAINIKNEPFVTAIKHVHEEPHSTVQLFVSCGQPMSQVKVECEDSLPEESQTFVADTAFMDVNKYDYSEGNDPEDESKSTVLSEFDTKSHCIPSSISESPASVDAGVNQKSSKAFEAQDMDIKPLPNAGIKLIGEAPSKDGEGEFAVEDPNCSEILSYSVGSVPPFICEHCNKTFSQKNSLISHLRSLYGIRPFKCYYCFKSFTQKSNLNDHITVHKGIRPFKCEYCATTFRKKSHLTSHHKIHDLVKPYICPHCTKSFRHLSSFKRHLTYHQGIRPYICPHCNKSFSQISYMNTHLKSHKGLNGSASFECPECNKTFTRKWSLNIHLQSHDGLHNFECEHCNKTFTRKSRLKEHMTVHDDVRPFPCPYCIKAFRVKNHLTKHVKTHEGIHPLNCS